MWLISSALWRMQVNRRLDGGDRQTDRSALLKAPLPLRGTVVPELNESNPLFFINYSLHSGLPYQIMVSVIKELFHVLFCLCAHTFCTAQSCQTVINISDSATADLFALKFVNFTTFVLLIFVYWCWTFVVYLCCDDLRHVLFRRVFLPSSNARA